MHLRGTDDSVLASYVHGAYIDDVVTMRRAVPQGGIPADWFFHSDDQFSVSAVTNAAGALAERVAYGDFGASTFLSPGGTAMVASAIGNPYAFTGRRWDAAERTYHYRFRTFSPGLGRFTTRDPIGIWGDALNLGNGYTYTGNDPWSWVDPWGLCETDIADSSFAGIFRSVTNTINDAVDSVVGAAVSVVRPAAIGIHEIEEGLLGIQDKDSRSLEGIGMTTRNVISNLTWESPQAFAGLLNTSFVLTVGNLYQLKNGGDLATVDASQYASLSVIQIYGGSPPGYGGAITLPPFIWYESKEMSHLFLQEGYGGVVFGEKIPTDLHEAIGHGSQSKDLGPVYLPLGLHSLCLNALQLENNSYIEVDANRRVRRYMEGKKQ